MGTVEYICTKFHSNPPRCVGGIHLHTDMKIDRQIIYFIKRINFKIAKKIFIINSSYSMHDNVTFTKLFQNLIFASSTCDHATTKKNVSDITRSPHWQDPIHGSLLACKGNSWTIYVFLQLC